MKVLKKGKPQKGWAKNYKCTGKGNKGGGCGALLRVEEDDLFLTFSHAGNETTTYIGFKCCDCGVLTDIWNDESGDDCPISNQSMERLTKKEKTGNEDW